MTNPAVASHSGDTLAADTSFTLTAPSGITTGDVLLLIALFGGDPGTFTPPSGWSTWLGDASSTYGYTGICFREADASDEAAADYSWTSTNSIKCTAWILRVTDAEVPEAGSRATIVYQVSPGEASYQSANALVVVNGSLGISAMHLRGDTWSDGPAGYTLVDSLNDGSDDSQLHDVADWDAWYTPIDASVDVLSGTASDAVAIGLGLQPAGVFPELGADWPSPPRPRPRLRSRIFRPRLAEPVLELAGAPDTDPADVVADLVETKPRPRVRLRPRRADPMRRIDPPEDAEVTEDVSTAPIAEQFRPRPKVRLRPRRGEPVRQIAAPDGETIVDPNWLTEPLVFRHRKLPPRPRRRRPSFFSLGDPLPDAPCSAPGTLTVTPFATIALVGIAEKPSFGVEPPGGTSTIVRSGPGTLTVNRSSC